MARSHSCRARLGILIAVVGVTAWPAAHPQRIAAPADLAVLAPLDASMPVTFYVATGAPEAKFRAGDGDLAAWALDAWSRGAHGALQFVPAAEERALLRIYWVPAGFGQYGEMRPILVDGRRGAALYIRPDTDALGELIAQRARDDALFRDTVVYLTCLHELGHALGLEHTAEFDDIMYFFGYGGDIVEYFDRYRRRLESRADIAARAGLSDSDVETLRTLYDIH